MVAERLATLAKGGDRKSGNFKAQICALTEKQAAALLNVSEGSVDHARAVRTKGTPALAKAVEQGRLAVSAAAKIGNGTNWCRFPRLPGQGARAPGAAGWVRGSTEGGAAVNAPRPVSVDWKDPKRWHPVTQIFPLMTDADLRDLAEDIRENGLQNPIVVNDGQLLDGRNRALACALRLSATPP